MKYSGLIATAAFWKIAAYLVAGVGALGWLIYLFVPSDVPFGLRFVFFLFGLVFSGILWLILHSTGELILVFLDIEKNTRETAESVLPPRV